MNHNSLTFIFFKLIFLVCISCQPGNNSAPQTSQEKPLIDTLILQKDSLNINAKDSLPLSQTSGNIDSDTIKLAYTPKEIEIKSQGVKKKIKPKAQIEFENEFIDFGKIKEGDIIKQKFFFKNVGNAPLEILSAKGSCGCTQPSYPFVEILPGESGFIGVDYNSVGKWGDQKVNIRVSSNARNSEYILYLKGHVNSKEKSIEVDTLSKHKESKQKD